MIGWRSVSSWECRIDDLVVSSFEFPNFCLDIITSIDFNYIDITLTTASWNAPKSMWRRYFARDGICIFFLKCPKIEHIQFRCFSRFKIDHVFFSRNAPLFYVRFSWIAPFFLSDSQKGTEIECVRFWGISGKKCICHHVQNISFTYFLGHFKYPPP